MTLIKSISGIRGTIGGIQNFNLTPLDIVKFTCAYAQWIKINYPNGSNKIVVGRDARLSGKMIENIVTSSLISMGFDVINIGLATTPTTEIAVIHEKADGGIIITASHNPANWNALKLLNNKGEFLNAKEGEDLIRISENIDENIIFVEIDKLGKIIDVSGYEYFHADLISKLPILNTDLIKKAEFKVVVDCVNSVGGIAVPVILDKLGVKNIIKLYCTPNGDFPHNPEPLPENIKEISEYIRKSGADVGFVVDPDVDRLAIICEDGSVFGEEYSLVAVADYVLSKTPGNTVSNLSSTRALRDITEKYGQKYFAAAVGEINVVEKMKEVKAIIGGEGNGGIIYPEIHYGRDALVGIALFLSLMAESRKKVSEIRKSYPNYFIAKKKIDLPKNIIVENIFNEIAKDFEQYEINSSDGLKIDFHDKKEWVHMRKSNTEPIIRIYAESYSEQESEKLAQRFINLIYNKIY